MNIRSLSQNEIDAIKILLAILEGDDTLEYIAQYTNLPKPRVTYLLRLLEKAGFIYKKEGKKRWRVRVNYSRVWKNAERITYNEAENFMSELEPIKELKEQEKRLARRP
jgi:DNA-binding IclR family transcriptional regulator